jgi:hypothetical protein
METEHARAFCIDRIFGRKPVSTFPENALATRLDAPPTPPVKLDEDVATLDPAEFARISNQRGSVSRRRRRAQVGRRRRQAQGARFESLGGQPEEFARFIARESV